MSTTTIQQNIIYGLGEGALVADTNMLAYALRYANSAYREVMNRHRFKHLQKRTIFRTTDGQQTYHLNSDFIGFITLKDEQNDEIIEQITPEDMGRRLSTTAITDEAWTTDSGVAVSLDNKAIVQYSETVTDGTTTYTRDTDYSIDYVAGTITMIAEGGLVDATAHDIDYTYYERSKPSKFCLEYDATNTCYVVRFDPTPDAVYIISSLYPAAPNDLSSAVNPIWDRLEFALERGGVFYGALEIIEDAHKRLEFKTIYEQAISALVKLDMDLVPKRARIQVALKKQDYYDGPTGTTY